MQATTIFDRLGDLIGLGRGSAAKGETRGGFAALLAARDAQQAVPQAVAQPTPVAEALSQVLQGLRDVAAQYDRAPDAPDADTAPDPTLTEVAEALGLVFAAFDAAAGTGTAQTYARSVETLAPSDYLAADGRLDVSRLIAAAPAMAGLSGVATPLAGKGAIGDTPTDATTPSPNADPTRAATSDAQPAPAGATGADATPLAQDAAEPMAGAQSATAPLSFASAIGQLGAIAATPQQGAVQTAPRPVTAPQTGTQDSAVPAPVVSEAPATAPAGLRPTGDAGSVATTAVTADVSDVQMPNSGGSAGEPTSFAGAASARPDPGTPPKAPATGTTPQVAVGSQQAVPDAQMAAAATVQRPAQTGAPEVQGSTPVQTGQSVFSALVVPVANGGAALYGTEGAVTAAGQLRPDAEVTVTAPVSGRSRDAQTADPEGAEPALTLLAAALPGALPMPGAMPLAPDAVRPDQPVTPQQAVASLAAEVAGSLRAAVQADGTTRVTVQTAELGTVEVEIATADDGALKIALRSDNPQVMHILRADRDLLLQVLRDSGMAVDSGALNLDDGQAGAGQGGRDGPAAQDQPAARRSAAALTDAAPAADPVAHSVAVLGPGRVDMLT